MRRVARVAFYTRVVGVAGVRAERRVAAASQPVARQPASRPRVLPVRAAFPPTFSRPPNTASFNSQTHENWINEDRSVKYLSDTCEFCCV